MKRVSMFEVGEGGVVRSVASCSASSICDVVAAARREAFKEAARIVGPDDALYAGPYPAEVCDVIAGVLLSRAAAIRALSNSTHRPE